MDVHDIFMDGCMRAMKPKKKNKGERLKLTGVFSGS